MDLGKEVVPELAHQNDAAVVNPFLQEEPHLPPLSLPAGQFLGHLGIGLPLGPRPRRFHEPVC